MGEVINLVEYGWILPVAWICISAGAAMALSAWIMHDRHHDKRVKAMVMSTDSWCRNTCRHYADCFGHYKDPDDAWKALDEYCYDCPMAMAVEEWEQQEAMKERSRQ